MTFESPIDRAIREATERGEFDNLPGTGTPLPDIGAHGENWWLAQFALREDAGSAFLPHSLLLRREADDLPVKVARLSSEKAVLAAVADLNRRIADEIRMPSGGPPLAMRQLDADAVVADWRAERDRRRATTSVPPAPDRPRHRWWRRGGR